MSYAIIKKQRKKAVYFDGVHDQITLSRVIFVKQFVETIRYFSFLCK